MLRSKRRLLALTVALFLMLVVSTLLYMVGMSYLEGEPRTFWQSFEWAGETLTTTGYGADASWKHPIMVLFAVALQFVGVFLVFLIVPIYLIPFLEERFETRIPRTAHDLRDHVVIYRYGPAVAGLLPLLAVRGVTSLVIEEDEEEARRLKDSGQRVILKSLEQDILEAAALPRARALVANGGDSENATVILAARQLGFRGELVAFVEEPFHREPIVLAGATAAFTPRHILGAALAARASDRIAPRLSGVQQIGRTLRVNEVRIRPDSPLAGSTLAEAGIGARTGATVIGQWASGKLIAPPTASMRIEPGGILVVVSGEKSVHRLEELAQQAVPLQRVGHYVVGGYGEVGRKVTEMLRDAGEEVRVVDHVDREGVDFIGDMLNASLLKAAGVAEARAVILALDTDSATLFAALIVKDLNPDVPVIARVSEAQNVERIHAAGADFALSISQVASQMLARRLLGEEAVEIDPQLKVLRVPAEALIGRHPTDLRIRERTDCSVVAVERGDEVIVEFGPTFRFEAEDAVYVSGSSTAVSRFSETMDRDRR
jgi:Trk K+ transport system NAD-binding subunit